MKIAIIGAMEEEVETYYVKKSIQVLRQQLQGVNSSKGKSVSMMLYL